MPTQPFDTRKGLRTDSKHLAVVDLELSGKPEIKLTIRHVVESEEVTAPNGHKTEKSVVYFKGTKKGLALGAKNTTRIADIAGSWMSDKWIGVAITIHLEDDRNPNCESGRGPCIRVKKGGGRPAPTPGDSDLNTQLEREPGEDDFEADLNESVESEAKRDG